MLVSFGLTAYYAAEDVVVTNAEIEGKQVVSTSFFVDSSGNVNKTQRVLVKIKESAGGMNFGLRPC